MSNIEAKEDLLKIALLANYAELCSIYLFEGNLPGKSQSLSNQAKLVLEIEEVAQAYEDYINDN